MAAAWTISSEDLPNPGRWQTGERTGMLENGNVESSSAVVVSRLHFSGAFICWGTWLRTRSVETECLSFCPSSLKLRSTNTTRSTSTSSSPRANR